MLFDIHVFRACCYSNMHLDMLSNSQLLFTGQTKIKMFQALVLLLQLVVNFLFCDHLCCFNWHDVAVRFSVKGNILLPVSGESKMSLKIQHFTDFIVVRKKKYDHCVLFSVQARETYLVIFTLIVK